MTQPKRLGDDSWRKLSAALKRRWWEETDYGKREPSDELMAAIEAELAGKYLGLET